MTHLVPCPSCERHLRASETTCPFCGSAVDLSGLPPPALPNRRLSRAALVAFGATIAAGVAATSCGGDTDEPDKGGSGGSAAGGGGAGGSGGNGSGGGSTGGNAGSSTGGSSGSSTGGSSGSGTGGDGGSVGPVYGIPVDAGSPDVQGTGGTAGEGGIQPPYGIPPDPENP
jgi:hypothetical protein